MDTPTDEDAIMNAKLVSCTLALFAASACSSGSSSPPPPPAGDGGTTGTAWKSVVGEGGFFAQSLDDREWSPRGSGTSQTLRAVTCASDTAGWVAGAAGFVGHTADGGKTWVSEASGLTSDLYAVRFASLMDGVVAGAGGALALTHDGGATWTTHAVPTQATIRGAVYSVVAGVMVLVGDGGTVLRSTDGGETFVASTLDPAAALLGAAADWTVRSVLVVDERGRVWASHDLGATFAVEASAGAALSAVSITDDGTHALAVGGDGTALERDAHGIWSLLGVPGRPYLRAALITGDGSHLYAAGDAGSLFVRARGDAAWTEEALGTSATLYGLDDF